MNNLPKVVTQRRLEQDLNSRPVDRKPKRLTRCTTAPPLITVHIIIIIIIIITAIINNMHYNGHTYRARS